MSDEQTTDAETWAPRYVVQKASGVGGEPIPDDEPVLVIRAQDALAPLMSSLYALVYEFVYEHVGSGADWRVIDEMQLHRAVIDRWQSDCPDSVKMADR